MNRDRSRTTASIVVAAMTLAMVAVACTKSSNSGAVNIPTTVMLNASTTTASADQPAATSTSNVTATPLPNASGTPSAVAYAACMRAYGVLEFPDPNSSGGFDKPKVAAASSKVTSSLFLAASLACQGLLSAQPTTQPSPGTARLIEFAQCMRAQGITGFPDPDSSGEVNFRAAHDLYPDSLQFRTALTACQHYAPSMLFGGPSS